MMKNFAKIFVAVAALFAYSCVTDTTEDLGVKLEGQTTEITLSLEESRTHLGEKADGIYPLYWSEGDLIAINGVASKALTAEQAGSAATSFVFDQTLTYPYNIVYPAPTTKINVDLGDVRAEGLQTVTFLAEQPYTVGSFAEGAAPMYGYATAETEGPIQMQHLAGVLCLAPKGEDVTLTSLVLKAESGKIAGDFTLNCVDGTLTATESASDTIVVPFAEPLTLTAEATPIYIALPAGEYGVLVATLHTANDSMTVRFNSSTKPVKAGVVREFAEFVYEANVVSDVFEIYDEASLRKFAKAAAAFYPYTSPQDHPWLPARCKYCSPFREEYTNP